MVRTARRHPSVVPEYNSLLPPPRRLPLGDKRSTRIIIQNIMAAHWFQKKGRMSKMNKIQKHSVLVFLDHVVVGVDVWRRKRVKIPRKKATSRIGRRTARRIPDLFLARKKS